VAPGATGGTTGDTRVEGGDTTIVTITGEQRTRVRTVFERHRVAPQPVEVRVTVGTVLPRTVRLSDVPQDIVVIIPQYRQYRYFVSGGQVVIVDPDTWRIVDVIAI
jgi:hypothetical protein